MSHYSSRVISGHIQHLAQRQFRVCLKTQAFTQKGAGNIFRAAKVTGTMRGTLSVAVSWADTTAVLNVLRVGGPTLTCFLGKREEPKTGKGNQVKECKSSKREGQGG